MFLWTAYIACAIHAAFFIWTALGLLSNPCNFFGCLIFLFIAVRQYQAVHDRNSLAAYNLTCIYFLIVGFGLFWLIFFFVDIMRSVSESTVRPFITIVLAGCCLFSTIIGYAILGWMNYQWAKFLSQIPWDPFPSLEEPPPELHNPKVLYGPPLQFSIGYLLCIMTLLAMILSLAKIFS